LFNQLFSSAAVRAAAPVQAGSWFSSQSLKLIQFVYHNWAFMLDHQVRVYVSERPHDFQPLVCCCYCFYSPLHSAESSQTFKYFVLVKVPQFVLCAKHVLIQIYVCDLHLQVYICGETKWANLCEYVNLWVSENVNT